MLIRNMNSIFKRHGRWIFAVITILIAISFLGFFTPGFTSIFGGGPRRGGSVGEIMGQAVSYDEVKTQGSRLYAMYLLAYAGRSEAAGINTNFLMQRAYDDAFSAIVMLKFAKMRNIQISDEEVAKYILEEPAFQENGKFSQEKLNEFADKWLKKEHLTVSDLDESIRDYLTIGKLESSIIENIVSTPGEIAVFNQHLNEKIEIAVADFKAANFTADVKLTDEDLENHYKTYQDKYKIPVSFNAELAVFKLEPVKASDEELKKYFEARKTFYSVDGKEVAFDSVKAKVAEDYSAQFGREAALKKARAFANELYEKLSDLPQEKQREEFNKMLFQYKIGMIPTGWFFLNADNIAGLQEPQLINEFAKMLRDQHKIQVTNAIAGKDAVYVGFVVERKDERGATFAEVKEDIRKEMSSQRAVEIARQQARDLVKTLAEAGPKVTEVAKANKAFKVLPPYDMKMPPQGMEGFYAVRAAETLPVGGFSQATETEDGALVVVVLKRTPASKEELDSSLSTAEYLYTMSKRQAASAAFQAWMQANVKQYTQNPNQ